MNAQTELPSAGRYYVAFEGQRRVACGALQEVASRVKAIVDQARGPTPQIFDALTSDPIDLDFSLDEPALVRQAAALERTRTPAEPHDPPTRRGRGRPRLGVVAREVTLLPRHWAWLADQPGGASAALRRLIDDARRNSVDRDRIRRARESAYRFMSATAGDLAGFEEALRALFADDPARFELHTEAWPVDVRRHARELAARTFAAPGRASST